ncbi:MAG: GTP-binding protein [Clostridia bacterium]|nr:GTP-binding protein [Clostridia bacterium]
MTKVDIFSGFLGAGKTTLIKKLIKEAFPGEKLVLIENEFGEIGVDGKFLEEAGVEITEMNSGCICCSLVGDFGKALTKVVEDYAPERILIEPSGVGKLSDVIKAVKDIGSDKLELNSFTTVVDAGKCKIYMKNFGEFFNDQVKHAQTIILSHTAKAGEERVSKAVELLREHNKDAVIVTTDWDKLTGEQLRIAMENKVKSLEDEIKEDSCPVCGHHHHEHHHHDEHCDCHDHDHEHHHHHHDEHCDCHGHEHHHHHHHDEHCDCHDHEHKHHHHEHDEHCTCGCHDHDHEHHHHHHADDVFISWGKETTVKYTADEMNSILSALGDEEKYGMVLRAKGIVEGTDGEWIHFDYVPGEPDVRTGGADIIGKLCVIGSKLKEDELAVLFKL